MPWVDANNRSRPLALKTARAGLVAHIVAVVGAADGRSSRRHRDSRRARRPDHLTKEIHELLAGMAPLPARQTVHDQLTAALRDQQRGIDIDPTRQTIGEFLATWLENTAKPSVRPKTYRSYEQMVRNHLAKTIPRTNGKNTDSIPCPVSKMSRFQNSPSSAYSNS